MNKLVEDEQGLEAGGVSSVVEVSGPNICDEMVDR